MRNVKGKTAFITGGASGIGFGMAQAFLNAGLKVVIADVRREALDEAACRLEGCHQPYHLLQVDVSDRKAMAAAAAEVEALFGNLHILCNNAGIAGATSIDAVEYEEWDWLVNVNLHGIMNGIVSFLPGMKRHGEGGHIVNTSSMAGLLPLPAPGGTYSALKFAVRGLSDSLRLALAYQNIGVSTLCPGLVRTNLLLSAATLMPASIQREVRAVGAGSAEELSASNAGMDPRVHGERVLQGILNNEAYILPHGEFAEEVGEVFADILTGFPLPDADPDRRRFEERRRAQTRAAAQAASAIG